MQATLDKFHFPWPLLRVVVEGASILDTPRLELKSMEEATEFVSAYGFDINDPKAVELLWESFEDAIAFIEKTLADPRYPKIPPHLRSRQSLIDLRRLLLMASVREENPDQRFACAILRVMHVLIHLAHDPRLKYFDRVQSQILSRLDSHLSVNASNGVTYLGDPAKGGIKLLFFKKKDRKDREREIVKLLHKTDSLVEEIYDRMGFRLVTETKFDAICLVRLLLEKNVISVANIRPGRSRNRLIDLKRLQFEIDRIRAHIQKNGGTEPYIEKMIKRIERRIGQSRLGRSLINPHTSEYYKAIQFTCRELVKIKNPLFAQYESFEKHLRSIHGGEQILAEFFSRPPNPDEYVFFPYEIQIMDVKSYADSIFGKSNHDEYRRKQLEVARNRVFGIQNG